MVQLASPFQSTIVINILYLYADELPSNAFGIKKLYY